MLLSTMLLFLMQPVQAIPTAPLDDTPTKMVEHVGALKVGETLPSFNGQTSVGGRVSSRTLFENGSVLVLSYAATWCQPCRMGLPIIESTVQSREEVQAVYIALDTEPFKVRKWAEDLNLASPIVVDRFNAVAKRHGVISGSGTQSTEIPITIVVDGNGVIRQIFTTEGPDFEVELEKAIVNASQVVAKSPNEPPGQPEQK